MLDWIRRYTHWLHTRWPAGTVERFPEVAEDGSTAVPGVFVAGDLGGVPLLKFSLDSGARVARRVADELAARTGSDPGVTDLVIVGGGVAGMAAAVEAHARGLSFEVVESSEPFSTLVNFPKGKPIYTYPRAMTPAGDLQVKADVKEALVAELRGQVERLGIRTRPGRAERVERATDRLIVRLADGATIAARRVLIAIGRSGDFRRLGVPGEDFDKVFNRLHDPAEHAGARVLVVGGGDTALETAIALVNAGAEVTLSYRGTAFARPRPENVGQIEALARDGRLALRLGTEVREIRPHEIVLSGGDGTGTLPNDVVYTMIGREAPLGFFRRSGIPVRGDWNARRVLALSSFLVFCALLLNLKSGGALDRLFQANHWFPYSIPDLLAALGGAIRQAAANPRTLLGVVAISASGPAFWYTLAYSIVVVVFGVRRIRRRRTPYVTAQTVVLMAVQVLPLFIIPEILLPWLDGHGLLPRGLADALFPAVTYGHGREFWRAYGLVLAWPLNVYNVFTHEPLPAWIAISIVQTLVLIPLGIWFFGKGVYCGWICSCGALAETLGDTHRHRMPHGPGWNRFNMAGQIVLAVAVLLLLVRIAGWVLPDGNPADRLFGPWLETPYKWTVDVFLGGVIGIGVYFWFSGRFWCRFFCPLAALMHVYARFSRFRIFADKKKCISCNQCTSVCHQGIDVMNFANKGLPMADPECVRCSACVQVCPTGVLSFGRQGRRDGFVHLDTLRASPVQMRERR